MYRIDNATAITPIPVPAAVGPKPNNFFTKGDAGLGIPATIVDDDWANAVQEEIAAVIEGAGLVLSKTVRTQLLTSIRSLTRIKLTGNTQFYVTTAGNDATGTGAIGAPWLTIQKAISSLLLNYDFGGFAQTINVGAGTFAGANVYGLGAGQAGIAIVLNGAGVGTTIINSTMNAGYGGYALLRNMTFTPGAGNAVVASEFGRFTLDTVSFTGAAGNTLMRAQLNAEIQIGGPITISGSASNAIEASGGSSIFCNNVAVTLTGTPAFSGAFALANLAGNLQVGTLTFVGGATGARYLAQMNGAISVGGGGASFLPGNAAGSTATGGQYA